ncbi:MAG: T9SS type A sorting domain-containing protein [Fibrobacteres bacterium]|nr:T9SS type A sorting domain-containing protein [Fibrobacterota bacterium]
MKKPVLSMLLVILSFIPVTANRISDFADSIPAGKWVRFPAPTLTPAMISSPPSGVAMAYANQAVWDSTTKRLMFIGAAHGSSVTRAFLYDATTDNWRNISTAREPYTSANRQGHTYDHLTMIPDSGVAYYATYTATAVPDTGYLYRYSFSNDKWDTLRAKFPGNKTFDGNYVYAGAMEYVPEWHGLVMLSGYLRNRGSFLDNTVATPAWVDFGTVAGGYYHSILDYNSVAKKLMNISEETCRLISMDKQIKPMKLTPFSGSSYETKLSHDPVTGTFLAYHAPSQKLFAYEPGYDLWQQIETKSSADLGTANVETAIFTIHEYKIIGVITNNATCVLYKYADKHDTTLVSLETYASKNNIEEWNDTALVTAVAVRTGGKRDTVNTSSFFVSLDTLVASVIPGGKIIPARSSIKGAARIEVIKNVLGGTFKDTIVINVVSTTATLDSVKLDKDSVTMLTGDRLPLNLYAYYHKGSQVIPRLMDTINIWSSSDAAVASVHRAQVRAVGVGLCKIKVNMAGKTDSTTIRVMQKPRYIKRIDLKGRSALDTTRVWGWDEDFRDVTYNATKGHGFTDGNAGSSSFLSNSNFLLSQSVSPYERVGSYKVNAPDGEYIIKFVMGGDIYGNDFLIYGTDTLMYLPTGGTWVTKVDTIIVSGGSGANFKIRGNLSYLILMSNDGTNLDSVSWDREPLTFVGDSAMDAIKADTTWPVSAEHSVPSLKSDKKSVSLHATPNPFNPSTRIYYSIGSSRLANCAIYDIKGRMVRSFAITSAQDEIIWDGCDGAGKQLSTGSYLVRVETAKEVVSCRLFLLK